MEIYINGRFLTQRITGVQRFALEFVKALDELINSNPKIKNKYKFTLLIPKVKLLNEIELKEITIMRVGNSKGHLWEQVDLLVHSRKSLLINLCNTGPIFKERQIVTIHDAAVYRFPYSFSFAFRSWYKIMFKSFGRRSRKIITVSNFSKKELINYCDIKQEKITVVTEGKEHIKRSKLEDAEIIRKNNLEHKKFIFAVSSLNPNKNFKRIIQAINTIDDEDFFIVIAGGSNPKVFKDSDDILLDNKVKYIGYISDNDLKIMYEHATGFIYPSLYEGFGLPPLEAMACGCPVIVSNTSSLPEVCGTAALYCDPYNIEDIGAKMKVLIQNEDLRAELADAGKERAKNFSWDKCAKEIFNVIEEALS
ncbi:glycosyltransferase family 4 protein [Metabacillus halosaccharovorans]|uniref:glycosyltransferase family 4 protein n=1 Tax=Metabacillus halosaccharovorans TaxID=930124 RepID=UPI0037355EDC